MTWQQQQTKRPAEAEEASEAASTADEENAEEGVDTDKDTP